MIIISVILITIILILILGNVCSRKCETENFTINSNRNLGLTIAHLSDLHYPNNGIATDTIIELLKSESPDIVVMTGDIFDGNASLNNIYELRSFFTEITNGFPLYFVIGNHEIGSDYLNQCILMLKECNVCVLLNETASLSHNGTNIKIIGLSDAYSYNEKVNGYSSIKVSDYKILLAHRPEMFNEYCSVNEDKKPDVVFCGHAHGGLARLGKIGLYAPNQGLFPKYTSGAYVNRNTTMILSRGLGDSGIDYRFFNKYHVPIVTIT